MTPSEAEALVPGALVRVRESGSVGEVSYASRRLVIVCLRAPAPEIAFGDDSRLCFIPADLEAACASHANP